MSGFFITFEGGEGSGKTTLIDSLSSYFISGNLKIIKVREPGGTILGEKLRDLVLTPTSEKVSPQAELCLYLSSRAQHIYHVIAPALKNNNIVLCDRFNDSTVAYQGYARGLGMKEVRYFCDFICNGLQINLTFYLDIDPKIGLLRAKKNNQNSNAKGYDRIESEKISFHQKIREAFLLIAKEEPKRFICLDATLPKEEIFQRAIKIIEERLLK